VKNNVISDNRILWLKNNILVNDDIIGDENPYSWLKEILLVMNTTTKEKVSPMMKKYRPWRLIPWRTKYHR
jgi:hypothetical protein